MVIHCSFSPVFAIHVEGIIAFTVFFSCSEFRVVRLGSLLRVTFTIYYVPPRLGLELRLAFCTRLLLVLSSIKTAAKLKYRNHPRIRPGFRIQTEATTYHWKPNYLKAKMNRCDLNFSALWGLKQREQKYASYP